jgi:radical SAM superfamily enzyme YgiQ (UPF0313 family)
MNILLVNLPSISFSLLDDALKSDNIPDVPLSLDIPLGLLYLSSYAKQYAERDFNIKLLDINKEIFQIFKTGKESLSIKIGYGISEQLTFIISQTISDFHPSIVGINVMFATVQQTAIFVSQIFKKLCPDAYIVGGGVQATNAHHALLSKGSFNAIIRGEGEIPFTELINTYETGKKEYQIAGVISLKNLENNFSASAEMIMELDEIPFPDYGLLDIECYITQLGAVRTELNKSIRALPIFTTRGCPMRCSFCASHSVHGRKIRARSLDNIYDEIESMIAKFQVNTLLIEDDLFTYKKQRTINFCDEAIKRKWNLNIEFTSGVAVWTLDEAVIDKLVKAGTTVINIAIESGSPYVQKHIIKKNINLEQARRVAEIISQYPHIQSRVFYVIGFPGERWEHIRETMNFAKSIPQDWSAFQIAMPLPGSELFEECVSLGYIQPDGNLDDFYKSYLNRNFDTKEFTKKEIEGIQSDMNIQINFLQNRNILNGNYKKALSIFQKIVESYPFHILARYNVYKCLSKLNMLDNAKKELESIFYWINKDKRAWELYDKYKSFLDMPLNITNVRHG